ncbi:autotransporter domain-containing protein [Serratia proteamaculans]
MNKSLYSFPLKPLVVALATAQCLTTAHAEPLPAEVTISDSSHAAPYVVASDKLTITPDGIVSTNSERFAVRNSKNTSLVDNQGTITNDGNIGFYNGGELDLLKNSGFINGGSGIALQNDNNINSLINSGSINAGSILSSMSQGVGLMNFGTITSLTNTENGNITGLQSAIYNFGTITTLNNDGYIGLYNNGSSIGNAIENSGTIGTINNSGTIAGNITNTTSNELVINGGINRRGSLIGSNQMIYSFSLPTSSPIGAINSTGADVRFQQGQLLLNDNVYLGGTHTLTNNADVLINESLKVDGNYHQTANAILRIGVSDASQALGSALDSGYGRLNVRGNAVIDAGSSIKLLNTGSYGFADGQRYVVIKASTADYNASKLHYSADTFNGTVTGTAISDEVSNTDNLVVYLSGGNNSGGGNSNGGSNTPKPGKPLPTTGNAISSLNGLSSYSGISSPALLNLFNASKTITTEAEANRIGEQLSPGQNSMASAATSAASMDALGVVGTHLDGLRITPGASARGIATGDDSLDWAAWGKPFYGSARQGMVDNVSGYRAHYGGLVLGTDRQILDSWRAGAALSYSRTSVKGQDNVKGSSSDVDAWGGILYATYSGEPWFVNLSTSLTRQSYDSQRQVAFDGFNDNASAHFTGQQVALKSEVGYPLALGANTTLTPLASLSYSYLHQGSYQENSDNGSALDVDSAHSQSVESSLGGKLAHSWSTPAGDLSPFVQVMWTHQYDRSPMTTHSGFSADSLGETRFTSQGARQAADSADTSVGVSLAHADDLTLEARYDLQTAPQFMGQTVSLQVRKLF